MPDQLSRTSSVFPLSTGKVDREAAIEAAARALAAEHPAAFPATADEIEKNRDTHD